MKIKSVYKVYPNGAEKYFEIDSNRENQTCESIQFTNDGNQNPAFVNVFIKFKDWTAKVLYNVDEIDYVEGGE